MFQVVLRRVSLQRVHPFKKDLSRIRGVSLGGSSSSSGGASGGIQQHFKSNFWTVSGSRNSSSVSGSKVGAEWSTKRQRAADQVFLAASSLVCRGRVQHFHSQPAVLFAKLVPFKLADIGEGIAECEIMKWHVNEGDQINQFDVICEVQSDKATVEITSRYDGTVRKLHYQKGEMAKVGTPLLDIEVAEEETEPTTKESKGGEVASAPSPPPSSSSSSTLSATSPSNKDPAIQKILTTPAVRYLASKHKLDLSKVKGTGRDGRIHKEDVLKLISAREKEPQLEVSTPLQSKQPLAEDKVVPLSGYSRIMAKTMTAAHQIPHFGYCDEIIVENLLRFRKEVKLLAEAQNIKLTNMPIFIKAASLALNQYPILNSSYDVEQNAIIYKSAHNIGVAMDTPNGLVVPNIKNVQSKSILDIAVELNRLQQAAQMTNLSKEDLSGGTFTLSNIGSIGGTYASPLLVVPEVAIGALGRIQKLPRYDENGNLHPVSIINVSWAADHRVIDGATMAKFSNLWKMFLENPSAIILHCK